MAKTIVNKAPKKNAQTASTDEWTFKHDVDFSGTVLEVSDYKE